MADKIKYRNCDEEDFKKHFRSSDVKITRADFSSDLIAEIQNSAAGEYNDEPLRNELKNLLAIKMDTTVANGKFALLTDYQSLSKKVEDLTKDVNNTVKKSELTNLATKTDITFSDNTVVKDRIINIENTLPGYIKNNNGVITKNHLNNDLKKEIEGKLTETSTGYATVKQNVANNKEYIDSINSFLSYINYQPNSNSYPIVFKELLPEEYSNIPFEIEQIKEAIEVISQGGVPDIGPGSGSGSNDDSTIAGMLLSGGNNGETIFKTITKSGQNNAVALESDYIFKYDVCLIRDNSETFLNSTDVKELSDLYTFLLYLPMQNDDSDNEDDEEIDLNSVCKVYYWYAKEENEHWKDVSTIDPSDSDAGLRLYKFSSFEGKFVREYDTDAIWFLANEPDSNMQITYSIKDLEKDVKNIKTELTTIKQNINTNKTNISNINTKLDNVSTTASIKDILNAIIDIILTDPTKNQQAKNKVNEL